MSLEHAILGWLTTGPGTGYDLARQLDQGLGWFWTAPHSQIYPRLKDMEARGLITSTSEPVGAKSAKRTYEITPDGRKAIREWTETPPTYPPNRDGERLRLIFGDHGNLAALRTHFETHRQHYQERRDSLSRFLHEVSSRQQPRIARRAANAPDEAHQELVIALREIAYRGDVHRAENEIMWAEDCLRWLDAFEVRHGLAEHGSGTGE
ncbi:PadR family transcriptional regulator [Streptomyces sioyaensis]|uniref:PadR family transcriptional regulator n=1 Tax=Streptomyces sioyaensis TaxID=67364 RepID=UPI0036BE9471